MAHPHPVEILIPMFVLGFVGFLFLGVLGGAVGAMLGAGFGSLMSVSRNRAEDSGSE